MNNVLTLSEHFFSVQCEGFTSGQPAYFMRKKNCNFLSIGVKPGRNIPMISTLNGRKKITEIKVGDKIFSHDEETNSLDLTEVKAVFDYNIDEHLEIQFDGLPLIYTSIEHPFLTNNGWKRAEDLTKGDEVIHYEGRKISSFLMKRNNPMKNQHISKKKVENTDYVKTGEKISKTRRMKFETGELKSYIAELREKDPDKYNLFCKKQSERMKEKNPMFNSEVVQKSKNAAHHKPRYKDTEFMSRNEHEFNNFCKQIGIDVIYTGRFEFPVENKVKGKGHIYPDFIIPNTNKVIEVFNSKKKGENRIGLKEPKYISERKEIYEKAGYECIFIDFTNLDIDESSEIILKLREHDIKSKNGIKFISSKLIKSRKKLQCYDFSCYPNNNFIVNGLVTHNCGGHNGELMKAGKATFWCDTETVWKQGKDIPFEEVINSWKEQGIYDRIKSKNIHLIWTGGEPTMRKSYNQIIEFLDYLKREHNVEPYNELETNGSLTLPIDSETGLSGYHNFDILNCSLKLSNSGVKETKRINKNAIEQIMNHPNYWFKFVISNEEDVDEIKELMEQFNIPLNKIIVMPGLSKREDYFERTKFTFEIAKKYGFMARTREHIGIWDQTTGV